MDGKRIREYWSNEMQALLDTYKQFQVLIPAKNRNGADHNGEDGREAIKDSKVELAIDSIFVDLNEACDNLLKDKTIEDIMNISK